MVSSNEWQSKLNSADSAGKLQIIDEIGQLENRERRHFGVPALIEALQDADDQVRSKAAFTLAYVAPNSEEALRQIVRRLDQELSSETDALRVWPLTDFLKCAGSSVEPVLPSLLRILKTFNEWKIGVWTLPWENTISAIGNCGPAATTAIPLLIEALIVATDEKVIYASLNSLVRIGSASARALMEFVTYDTRAGWYARHEAVMALGRIEGAAAQVTPFLKTMANLNTSLSKVATESLAQLASVSSGTIPSTTDAVPVP